MATKRTTTPTKTLAAKAKPTAQTTVKTNNTTRAKTPAVKTSNQQPGREMKMDQMIQLSRETIAERAYFIWLNKGRPWGNEMEHWLQAETELRQHHTRM